MISPAEWLTNDPQIIGWGAFVPDEFSRFSPGMCYRTRNGEFNAHVRVHFLSPQITYAVNLVFKWGDSKLASLNPWYFGIYYHLEGEELYFKLCPTEPRKDGWLRAELFQFESEGRDFDLKILFEWFDSNFLRLVSTSTHRFDYIIEGIEFRPIEKVEHEVLEDDKVDSETISESDETYWENKLPNDYNDMIKRSKHRVQWTTKKELYSILYNGFLTGGSEWFFLDKSGKRCLMLPAREALVEEQWNWKKCQFETRRFEEVAFDPIEHFHFRSICKIKSQIMSLETTYASYLVYKLPEDSEDLSRFEYPLRAKYEHDGYNPDRFIYLLNPQTPVVRPKVGQNSYNPLNRPRLKGLPKQRRDGWMEVQLYESQPGTDMKPELMHVNLSTFLERRLKGLTVQGVEFRPL